jgi:ATP adenylyltransferase
MNQLACETTISDRSSTQCAFCSNISEPRNPWDRPLFESENFVAIPSLGSLVEGWVLLVPRKHFISTGALTPTLHDEFSKFKRRVWAQMDSLYGEVCAFEHGPYAPTRAVGCGVDHAHVHLLPLGFDLLDASTEWVERRRWQTASWSDCQGAFETHRDYLFVEQPLGVGRIALAERFDGQILRRAIAAAIGRPDEFNWRIHHQQSIIQKTIDRFAPASLGV